MHPVATFKEFIKMSKKALFSKKLPRLNNVSQISASYGNLPSPHIENYHKNLSKVILLHNIHNFVSIYLYIRYVISKDLYVS